MYKNKKIIAIIPARKGSKGIPKKNIKKLNGIPLVEYSLLQATKSKFIDKIIVSTDSEEIYKIAKKYNADNSGLRPKELSTDTAIIYDVVKYELEKYQISEEKNDIMVLLQPTSPLRKTYMIDDAIKNFVDKNQISAVSVSEVEEHPIYMRTIDENNKLNRIIKTDSTIRRQDLPKYYKVNGMIYINKVIDILKEYISFNDNISPILIQKKYDIDIDDMNDWIEVEKRISNL